MRGVTREEAISAAKEVVDTHGLPAFLTFVVREAAGIAATAARVVTHPSLRRQQSAAALVGRMSCLSDMLRAATGRVGESHVNTARELVLEALKHESVRLNAAQKKHTYWREDLSGERFAS